MGWERKRGALAQFNKLVLGKLTSDEMDKHMTLIYNDIIKAKYAITIDEDTTLSLNSAKDLVAITAHPLNKPVLNKEKTRVKKDIRQFNQPEDLNLVMARRGNKDIDNLQTSGCPA